jgi:chromosome partitioning protein
MRIAIINLKGGTGKTTSAIYTALAFNQQERTLLIDADPQGSSLSWSESAKDFPLPVIGLPVKDMHRRISNFDKDYRHVVIDTPPGEVAIVRGCLLAADRALLTISPGLLDIDRLRPTLELLEEVEHFNNLPVTVLLTRVRRGTKSAAAAREILTELNLDVLETEIPLLESYASSFGLVPTELGEYGEALKQILDRQVSA